MMYIFNIKKRSLSFVKIKIEEMLVKVYGSAVFRIEATTITVVVFVEYKFLSQKRAKG